MKIQCDVCAREEAAVFCCADEAALCGACDRSVHLANKLAGKHRRLPLLLPSTSSDPDPDNPHPLCDVCQEKRGFVFCREDRAILCKDCDAPIHTANNLTMKHSRFLLTGARLSATPIPSDAAPPPEAAKPEHSTTKHRAAAVETHQDQSPAVDESVLCNTSTSNSSNNSGSSSISEYLIKMLPGWRVEDLLVDDAAAVAAGGSIRKTDQLLPFLETGGLGARMEDFPIWVPRVRQIPHPDHSAAAFGGAAVEYRHGFRPKDVNLGVKPGLDQWNDDGFTVPQISPALGNNKRPRPSLWYL